MTDLIAATSCGSPLCKVPTSWELSTEQLPRNRTGKILRTALLDESEVPA